MMENCSGKVLFIVQSDGELLRNLTSIVTRHKLGCICLYVRPLNSLALLVRHATRRKQSHATLGLNIFFFISIFQSSLGPRIRNVAGYADA